jgi:hypothetical protein
MALLEKKYEDKVPSWYASTEWTRNKLQNWSLWRMRGLNIHCDFCLTEHPTCQYLHASEDGMYRVNPVASQTNSPRKLYFCNPNCYIKFINRNIRRANKAAKYQGTPLTPKYRPSKKTQLEMQAWMMKRNVRLALITQEAEGEGNETDEEESESLD